MKRRAQIPIVTSLALLAAPASAGGITERVSLSNAGAEGNAFSETFGAISANGRFAAFTSEATNLVAHDTNGVADVFVRDRTTGKTERVSVGKGGQQANGFSYDASISADGRIVAFRSAATNLLPGNPTGLQQSYAFDRKTGRLWRASVGPGGVADNDGALGTRVSANGRYVSFTSFGDNLVPNDTNDTADVFIHDLWTRKTSRVSVTRTGGQICDLGASGGIMSADGRLVSVDTNCPKMVPGPSNDGTVQGYIHDRKTGKNERVTVGPNGVQPNASFNGVSGMSADGRFVSLLSEATNLVAGGTNGNTHVFVRDRTTGTNELASVGPGGAQSNGFNSGGEMSANGRFVAFSSAATNLVPNDTNGQDDIFVHDRKTGKTRRVSVGPGGLQSNGRSIFQGLTAFGRTAVFSSEASNLVPGDTNGVSDVFVHSW